MFKRIKNYSIGSYYSFLLWLDGFFSDLSNRTSDYTVPHRIEHNIQKEKLERGIKQIKDHVNNLVASKNKEEYDSVLKKMDNLIELAEDTVSNARLDQLKAAKKAWIYSGTDIKSSIDRAVMIDKRIKDYKLLQADKLKRQELRKQRKNKD